MSKRLQVLINESEYAQIQQIAARKNITVAEWVRHALREAKREEPAKSGRLKLDVRGIPQHDIRRFKYPDVFDRSTYCRYAAPKNL